MKRSPLRKMSSNKARETAKYWPLRRKFIEEHPFCEFPVNLNDDTFTASCVNRATQVHHKKGQHWKVMNDTRYWLGVCAKHHTFLEDNKKWARKRGLILYK